ncbi:hypothetical protein AGABI1DRAFT_111115 [Agaricus bisporus var. burnettii JB137-S8]|uniref:Uncharacterized protein n=1 Tax=Agaricus bisporus var. burnettii (strain JB137-S8 / ATCC MYA-4627 / FGSC 10392) TaxID=597362 RepID=K5XGU9_AGABU|nr:uncharacterized protein AGABI1DRAFT_111115 [Agaricus bisporus var. burnettii JB137-S8]EKM82507.1 hypothetical protein AGABI1DRAFT_111115 [Agaricus bisporus var. burnettii JB137-S8]
MLNKRQVRTNRVLLCLVSKKKRRRRNSPGRKKRNVKHWRNWLYHLELPIPRQLHLHLKCK